MTSLFGEATLLATTDRPPFSIDPLKRLICWKTKPNKTTEIGSRLEMTRRAWNFGLREEKKSGAFRPRSLTTTDSGAGR